MLESPRYVPCCVFHFAFSQRKVSLKAERTRGSRGNNVLSDRLLFVKEAQSNTCIYTHSVICSFPECD